MASWLSSLAEVGNQLLGVDSGPTGKDAEQAGITVYANGTPGRLALLLGTSIPYSCSCISLAGAL